VKQFIDLNCDLGEFAGEDAREHDAEIMKLISSANIACGFHAGDPHVMRRTVELAATQNVGIGAHPGLADREGFGRRSMPIIPAELYDDFIYQVGALAAFAKVAGKQLQHVKMHGVLVEMARADESLARAMCEATRDVDARLIWLAPTGVGADIASKLGLKVAREFYADRAYHTSGSLVSRTQPGAVIKDLEEIEDRVTQLLEAGTTTTIEGQQIPIDFDSICVHSDTPQSLEIVRVIREACLRKDIAIARLAT
jgi:5-oxoprolinase (ATP-hydrolysing) subunit A